MTRGRTHVVIGDTQVKPGVPTRHLEWIGRYIVDHFAGQDIQIVHVGDHWDMPSLSSYDKGTARIEGKRYVHDVRAGNSAFDLLNAPLLEHNKRRRVKWRPKRTLLLGNHEHRIVRASEEDAQLEGLLSLDALNAKAWGWDVVPFLEPRIIDGVHYAHYFYHPNTGRPYGGENLYTRLKNIGHSFTMGHQQGMAYAVRPVGGTRHHGLVVGSCYLHEEKYLGPQATAYWRGIVVCHQVHGGTYDPMFVSLDYLCHRYEKKTLRTYLEKAA
jgi:hypothetical protein